MSNTNLQRDIQSVTDPARVHEDWSTIMNICDVVAADEVSAEIAISEIERNLRKNPFTQGWRSIALTLTLLEALVNNGGDNFHVHLADEDFLKTLKGVIAQKNEPPLPIEEQVLSMIQQWATTFRHDSNFTSVQDLYQECKRQGYRFPSVNEKLIGRSASAKKTKSATEIKSRPTTAYVSNRADDTEFLRPHVENNQRPTLIRNLTDEQICKLRSELDIVNINVDVFEEMLVTLEPGNEHPQDWELLIDLYQACKKMQARVVGLLSLTAIDDIAVDLLHCNDKLNKAFHNYHQYKKKLERPLSSSVSNRQSETRSKIIPSPPITPNAPFYFEVDNDDRPRTASKLKKTTSNHDDSRQTPIEDSTNRSRNVRHYSEKSYEPPLEQNQSIRSLPVTLPPITLSKLPSLEPKSVTPPVIEKKERTVRKSALRLRNYDQHQDEVENYNQLIKVTEESSKTKDVNDSEIKESDISQTGTDFSCRVKRLTINDNVANNSPYKITAYHRIEPD